MRKSPNTFVFPTDFKIKYYSKDFKFDSPITVTDIITIFTPKSTKEQNLLHKNWGGRIGAWFKKGGNAEVIIGGVKQKVQLHFYENSDGSIAGAKIVKER